MIRAMFTCTIKKEMIDGFVIEMLPVFSGSPENEQFYKYISSGKIEFGTVNKCAANNFVVGKSYYIDFTLARIGAQDTPSSNIRTRYGRK